MRTSLVCNPFISPEIIDPKFVINMPVNAIASSRLIYATTPVAGTAADDIDLFVAWNLAEKLG
ncbi:MAG: hypothetical protein VB140_08350 [Burkholderia sp.]